MVCYNKLWFISSAYYRLLSSAEIDLHDMIHTGLEHVEKSVSSCSCMFLLESRKDICLCFSNENFVIVPK